MPKIKKITSALVSNLKSAIHKKKPKGMQFDFAKYGVKKENSFIGSNLVDVNLSQKGKKFELDGVYLSTKQIKIIGAESIIVTKGCLTSNKITLDATKSITIQGHKTQVFQTTLEATEFIKLKAPTVILNGVILKSTQEESKPSLEIEANLVKIHNCVVDVWHATIKDDGQDLKSVITIGKNRTGSESEFSCKTLELQAINVCFSETVFQCEDKSLPGSLEIRRAELIDIIGIESFPSLQDLARKIDSYMLNPSCTVLAS